MKEQKIFSALSNREKKMKMKKNKIIFPPSSLYREVSHTHAHPNPPTKATILNPQQTSYKP